MGIYLHTWLWISFAGYTVELYYREDQDSKAIQNTGQIVYDNGKVEWLRDAKCEFAFEAGTRNFKHAEWILTDAAGRNRKLTVEKLYQGIYWEGGWSGDNPKEYRGPFRTEGEVWELTKEKQVELGKVAKDQFCRYYLDGDKGVGIFEYVVSKRHKKYGPQL